MQSHEMTDVAVTLTLQSEKIIRVGGWLPESALQSYWVICRSRHNLWHRQARQVLDRCEDARSGQRLASPPVVSAFCNLAMHVLLSEPISRIWAAILHGVDARNRMQEYGPIGQSVLQGHLDARFRVLRLLQRWQADGRLTEVNLLRRAIERWTDGCLATLPQEAQPYRYAFDPPGATTLEQRRSAGPEAFGALMMSGHWLFQKPWGGPHLNHALQQRVHTAILGCLASRLFTGDGTPLSASQLVGMTEQDSQFCLLEEWLKPLLPCPTSDGYKPGMMGRF